MVLVLVLSSFVSCKRKKVDDPTLPPDYAPPQTDKNAEEITGEGETSKIDTPKGGGSVGLIYEDKLTIDLSEKKVISMNFGISGRSVSNVILQIMVQGKVVAQTDLIKPGNRLRTADLKEGAEALLQPGIYSNNAKFVVNCYDPDSNEKSAVKQEIPVTITVQE